MLNTMSRFAKYDKYNYNDNEYYPKGPYPDSLTHTDTLRYQQKLGELRALGELVRVTGTEDRDARVRLVFNKDGEETILDLNPEDEPTDALLVETLVNEADPETVKISKWVAGAFDAAVKEDIMADRIDLLPVGTVGDKLVYRRGERLTFDSGQPSVSAVLLAPGVGEALARELAKLEALTNSPLSPVEWFLRDP